MRCEEEVQRHLGQWGGASMVEYFPHSTEDPENFACTTNCFRCVFDYVFVFLSLCDAALNVAVFCVSCLVRFLSCLCFVLAFLFFDVQNISCES